MIKLFLKQYALYFYAAILIGIISASFFGGLKLGKLLEQDKYNNLAQQVMRDQIKINEDNQKIINNTLKEYAEQIKKDHDNALKLATQQQEAAVRQSIRRSIVEGLEKGLKGALYSDPNCEIPADDLKIVNDAIKESRK